MLIRMELDSDSLNKVSGSSFVDGKKCGGRRDPTKGS